VKQAQPEDEVHGLVQLPVLGEIRVKDIDRLTYEEFTRTVTCPQCGTTQGLTLRADGDTAVVICPQDQRAFDEPHIHAMEVRLLSARPLPQGPLDVPSTPRGAPWLDITPVLDEDRTLAPFRFLDEEDDDDPRVIWESGFGYAAEENGPAFMIAMVWARWLMAWALPQHGRLYHQVFDNESPDREAHMILVALGLALYESTFQAGTGERMAALPLTKPMAWLSSEGDASGLRQQLRTVRPLGDHMLGGRLRLRDITRLESCAATEWDRWCEGAFRILAVHLKEARTQSARERGARIGSWEWARLTDRGPAGFFGEDMHFWYAERTRAT
jgi:hypothetical protein